MKKMLLTGAILFGALGATAEVTFSSVAWDEFVSRGYPLWTGNAFCGGAFMNRSASDAFDGNLSSFWEPATENWSTGEMYVGSDLGEERIVSAVAFMPYNEEHDGNNLYPSVIQYASQADFSDAKDVGIVPEGELPSNTMTIMHLDSPVKARYFRLKMAAEAGWPRVAEMRFIAPLSAVLSENGIPIISFEWSIAAVNGAILYRSCNVDGPYDTIATLDIGETTYCDKTAAVDTHYYYRVAPVGIDGNAGDMIDTIVDIVSGIEFGNTNAILSYCLFGDYFASDRVALTGTPFSGGNYNTDRNPYNLSDANDNSWWEPDAAKWETNDMYAGFDLGEEKTISGFSFTLYNWGYAGNSLAHGHIQVGNAADFSDMRTVYVVSDSSMWQGYMYSVNFIEPIRGRYIRFWMPPKMSWPYLAEFEAVGLASINTNGDGHPELKLNPATFEHGAQILRATEAEGLYKTIAEVGAGQYLWVDNKAKMGQQYFYRVARIDSEGGVSSAFEDVFETFGMHQLERDPAEPDKLKDGCSVFVDYTRIDGDQYSDTDASAVNAFDGDVGTNPDIYGYGNGGWYCYNAAVGVDFGSDDLCHVRKCRVRLHHDWQYSRAHDVVVWGSNNPDAVVADGEALSDPVPNSIGAGQWYEIECDSSKAYRYIYLRRDSSDNINSWCGNVMEVEFYGWRHSERVQRGMIVIIH